MNKWFWKQNRLHRIKGIVLVVIVLACIMHCNQVSAATEAVTESGKTYDFLEFPTAVCQLIMVLIGIIGGVMALNYLSKLRQKQKDATFNYLTKLNVRVEYFYQMLLQYKETIMDCYVPVTCRREAAGAEIAMLENMKKRYVKNAEETLLFLKNENEQMPAKKGWTEHFNLFLKFLIDCEQMSETTYFKWRGTEENLQEIKENYYLEHLKNMEAILKMIQERQEELEDEIFRYKKEKERGEKR